MTPVLTGQGLMATRTLCWREGRVKMAQPIYKTFLAKPSEAWYQLSKADQDQLIAKLQKKFADLGCKRVILCDSSWSSDQWTFSGVEEFPSIEAVQQYHAFLGEINWSRYMVNSATTLGTKAD